MTEITLERAAGESAQGHKRTARMALVGWLVVVAGAPAPAADGPGEPQSEFAAWVALEHQGRCEDYRAFLKRFPAGKLTMLAAQHVAESCQTAPAAPVTPAGQEDNTTERDQALWAWATIEANCDAFTRYLHEFPAGEYAAAARERRADCAPAIPLARRPSRPTPERIPAPAPAPAPARAPALALAPVPAVSPAEVEALVARYLQTANAADVEGIVGLYAGRPSYYTQGQVDKQFIRKDKRNYVRRWPHFAGRLNGPIAITSLPNGDADVHFRMTFEVSDAGHTRGVSGQAEIHLVIGREGGAVRITSIREEVLSRNRR